MAQLTQSTPLVNPRDPSRLSNVLWWLMLLSSAAIAVYAATYFIHIPNDEHFSRYIFPLRLHIAGGIGALLAGPWQFSQKLRDRALNLHRWLGRFYVLSDLSQDSPWPSSPNRACPPISVSGFSQCCGSALLCRPIAWYALATSKPIASG